MQMLHFMAGLPRSGSTALVSLLSQNPHLNGVPVSGLADIFHNIFSQWEKNDYHRERPDTPTKHRVLKAVLSAYAADLERPVVIDKNRLWISLIPLLEEILDRQVKIIVPVRPVVEILASFENIRSRNPLELTLADVRIGVGHSTIATRADYFANATGALGSAYNATKDAVASGFSDRLLFVDYNKLVNNPRHEIHRIYTFLGEEPFEHDFERIQRPGESDWRVHQLPGIHDVRQKLERTPCDAVQVLGKEVYKKYYRPFEWWDKLS